MIRLMKLRAKIKLQPNRHQYQALLETLQTANDACNDISDTAWQAQTFGKFKLQKRVYDAVKELIG